MSERRGRATALEVVPLADRLRFLQVFRLVVAVVAVVFGLLSTDSLEVPVLKLLTGTGAFLSLSLAAEMFWRSARRRGLPLFSAMLIVDGFYLAAMTYATGGAISPMRNLIVLHLIAVALLGSYRTGIKLALWHSLLLIVFFHAQEAGLLAPIREPVRMLPGTPFEQLSAFVAVLWLVALATSSLSAVNERELRRRRFDLEALARMARELELARGQGGVARVVAAHVADVFDAPRVAVLGLDHGRLRMLAAVGATLRAEGEPVATGQEGETPARGLRYHAGSLVERAVAAQRAVLASRLDAGADPGLATLLPDAANLVAVPLSAEGAPLGLLVIEHAVRGRAQIERRAVMTLERFASQAAFALRNAALFDEVRRLAATDGLTGLANRRTFDSTLEREVARAARTGEDVTLVLLDIDHFKAVNDAYGHQVGDEVIRSVAGVAAAQCREYDTAARYGGEEIALVLPGCDPSSGSALAERVRAAVAAADLAAPVTISAGTATFPVHATSATELVGAADGALYTSKRGGRDRVSAAPPVVSNVVAVVDDVAEVAADTSVTEAAGGEAGVLPAAPVSS